MVRATKHSMSQTISSHYSLHKTTRTIAMCSSGFLPTISHSRQGIGSQHNHHPTRQHHFGQISNIIHLQSFGRTSSPPSTELPPERAAGQGPGTARKTWYQHLRHAIAQRHNTTDAHTPRKPRDHRNPTASRTITPKPPFFLASSEAQVVFHRLPKHLKIKIRNQLP